MEEGFTIMVFDKHDNKTPKYLIYFPVDQVEEVAKEVMMLEKDGYGYCVVDFPYTMPGVVEVIRF